MSCPALGAVLSSSLRLVERFAYGSSRFYLIRVVCCVNTVTEVRISLIEFLRLAEASDVKN
jgi:hypothetical protein